MLRINLLPAYIAERRKVRTAIAVATALWLIVLVGGLVYTFGSLQPKVAAREQEATAREADAAAEQAYESATTQLRSKIAPLQEKVAFVEAVRYHNRIRQKIFRQAAAYTYREIELNSMAVAGNTLSMGAIAKSVGDIGRFYIYMFGNPDVTAVSISQLPGYNQVRQQTPVSYPGGPPPLPPSFPVTLTATLVQAVAPPQLPAGLGAGGAGGAGIPGMPPGMPGPGMDGMMSPEMAGPPSDTGAPAPDR
jgi:hypothetical protein